MNPRVFIVQQPAFFDREKREFVPKYDLSPASAHGELVYLLGPGSIFRDRMQHATKKLAEGLADFSESDSILAVGDPVAIAAAVLIAGKQTGGRLKLLKWDRLAGTYEAYTVNTKSPS